jgi:hypothetical protein
MSTYGQGEKKYLHPRGQVLLSSVGRGWSGIAADTRLPHLARPAPSVVEHPIIASNMETNGAITAKRAYVFRFRISMFTSWSFMRREAIAMNDRFNSKIGRRDMLRVLAFGAAAATTSGCSSVAAEDFPDKRKARYHADSPEVQTFYRVNRYPAAK